MEWFRWYHGTVADPKFTVIAKRAKQPRHVVIACWTAILEHASTRSDRGCLEEIDHEEIAASLDLETEQIEAVYQAMVDKGMIVDGRLKSWEKRQPKREDSTGAERKGRWKRKKNEDQERMGTHGNACGTQENETERLERARTEQNRTEERREEKPSSSSSPPEEMPPQARAETLPTAMRMTTTDFRFLWHEAFGTIMPGGCAEKAGRLCLEFLAPTIREAFQAAAVHGKPTLAYVEGVLRGNGTGKGGPARASPSGPVSFEKAKSNRTKQAVQEFVERRKRAECHETTSSSGPSSTDSPRPLEWNAPPSG